jgi:hypothetical protein
MREIVRTNDAVLLSFVQSILGQAGISTLLADQYISIVEGSICAFPRRLLVGDQDWPDACRVLADAGLHEEIVGKGEAQP